MKIYAYIAFIFLSMILLASCEKDYVSTKPADNGGGNEPPPVPGAPVSYKDKVLPIFTANCLGNGCHGAGGPSPTLTADKAYDQLTGLGYVDPADTIPENSKLYQRLIGTSKPMPPSGKLGQNKLDYIKLWIQQGSQNN